MKAVFKILVLTLFVLVANAAFARGGEENPDTDPKEVVQQGEKKSSSEVYEEGENIDSSGFEDDSQSDSTDDESLSKHNFIFYLLYKMRYNEDQTLEALF